LKADQRVLVDLAASVADGTAVDWSQVETRADAAGRRLVSHLRLVESIANLHKSIPDDRRMTTLAASVADGTAVDWTTAEAKLAGLERRLVRNLRLVESISSLHRTAAAATQSDDTTPDEAQAPSGPRWGHLVLLERIGQGMSSEVFRAWDSTLHQEVALKLLHENGADAYAQARLLEEARRLARVRHNHVVQVYGADEHDGRVGLWMELVRGESFEQLVKARGPFGDREAALIGLDLCAALAAVHGAGLLHRDVKSQNVMREQRGRIVLMDFGTGEELAGTNRLVGTPLYLAPEIFRGEKASVQSDLYSVGVLLFYLVSGKFPVTAASMEQLGNAHERGDRRSLRDARPDVPETFVRVVERALDRDVTRRYRTVGEMESALREAIAPQVVTPVAPAAPAVRKPRVPTAFLAAAAVLVALIAGLIVWTRWPAAPAVSVRSLAVLPVAMPGPASSELSDAVTGQLIDTLAKIQSIRTTSVASVLPFKQSNTPRVEIAKLLGVDAVLEGVLTVIDDAKSGSGRVTGRRGELPRLLSEVARNMTSAIGAPVTEAEKQRLGDPGTKRTNPVAEEAYLQGRLHLAAYGRPGAERALKAFQRATAADPGFAAAHAATAFAYVKLAGFGGISHGEAVTLARNEIKVAREIGLDTAEAHAAEADLKLLYEWDWDGAEAELETSIQLNPTFMYARYVYAQLLAARHRTEESLKISEESLRIDPQSVEAVVNHGMILYYARKFDEADQAAARALAMQPGYERALLLRARNAEAQGRFADALSLANQAAKLAGDGNANLRVVIIGLLALNGRLQESLAATEALEKAGQDGSLRVRSRDLAYICVAQGKIDAALDHFERALDERDPSLIWLTIGPRVDPLRKEPRFKAILQRMGLD
jgi:serine/threonine protein kinase/tetratricopeptide (TPR) repeat protein